VSGAASPATPEPHGEPAAGPWPARELTENELQLGLYVYALIFDWKSWLHRRVEQVEFADPVTYRRRTSIDFTVPLRETPLARAEDQPVFCIPLALLRKRRLRNFSLRDQDGTALPLLTQAENGAVGAGVLIAGARAAARRTTAVPRPIAEDLWRIAHLPSSQAAQVWQHLGRHCRSADAEESEWGRTLVGDEQFMALAADLARNFLVLSVMRGLEFGERRIVKLSYEQEGQRPAWTVTVNAARARAAWRAGRETRRKEAQAEEAIREHGQTLVRVTAISRTLDPATGELGEAVAQPGVRVSVICTQGTVTSLTGEDGRTAFAVPRGKGQLATDVPPGLVEHGASTEPLELSGEEKEIALEYRHVRPSADADASEAVSPPISLRQLVSRSIAWRPRPIVVLAPAVGHAESYHTEIEAPEGVAITRGRLVERPSYRSAGSEHDGRARQDIEPGPVQRVHLHVRDVAQSSTGASILLLRPRSSVIVRTGVISTAASTVLIWLVGDDRAQLTGVLGTVATLLLVIPGGLSAYVSRPRENPLTSSMVFGLRLLTLASAFVALAAAATVVLSHRWNIGASGTVTAGGEWPAAGTVLSACFWLSLLIFLVLALSWMWTVRLPERHAWESGEGAVGPPAAEPPSPSPSPSPGAVLPSGPGPRAGGYNRRHG
jgi:hypothetical protein